MRSMSSSDIFAFARTFSVTSTGPVSMIAGSEPILANALMRIRGFNPAFSPASLLPISTAAAPSTMPDELPAWCTWLIVSSSGCACTATASNPLISPSCTKEGLSCAKDCMVVLGHVFILGEDGEPIHILDRNHRARETALVPRSRRAPLALHGIGVDVVAGETVFSRDEVGRNPLRHEIGFERDRGVHGPGATRGADADPTHGFDPSANGHVVLPRHDLGCGKIDRVEPRGAKAIDLDARHAIAIACRECRHARDIAAGLADRIDTTKDHVIDERRVELIALLHRGQRLRRQIERSHLMQRAICLAAPSWRANVIVDEGVGHRGLRGGRGTSVAGGGRMAECWHPSIFHHPSSEHHRLLAMRSFMISLVPA